MLVVGFPSGALQANCYLLAAAAGEPCVIVDPGQDAVEPIMAAIRQHNLSPVAVLLTHGHFDHSYSVAPVSSSFSVSLSYFRLIPAPHPVLPPAP